MAGKKNLIPHRRATLQGFGARQTLPRGTHAIPLLLLVPVMATGQGTLSTSAVLSIPAAPRTSAAESQPYTIKTGDFRLLLSPSLTLEYSDNVSVSDSSREDDFIIRPMLQMNGSYPIGTRNLLRINVGVGYDYYLEAEELRRMHISSGSDISFDTYIAALQFNFHERFQYTHQPQLESGAANAREYGGFQNTIGLSVSWPQRKFVSTIGYDHQNYISSSDEFNQMDRASEIFSGRLGYQVHHQLIAGVEGTATLTSYDQQQLNDSTTYSGGVYAQWQPGQYFSVSPRVGYTVMQYRQTSDFIRATDMDAWYAGINLSHSPTEAIAYNLSAGRELRLGVQADAIEEWYVRPSVTWNFIRGTAFSTYFSYSHGSQGSGNSGGLSEEYEHYSAGISMGHAITERLNGSLSYTHTLRTSDVGSRDYAQNRVSLGLTYSLQ